MAATFSAVRQALAGISPRERRLLTILAATVGLLVLLGGYYWASVSLDDLETERATAVDALRTIRSQRYRIRQRQERREQALARYRTKAPPLTSFVEEAARAAGVTVAEATDRSVAAAEGRRFQKRAVSIQLRRVNLQSLATFMERIESAEFPVAITSIRIRKVFGESNLYNVDDMVIATFDRVETPSGRGTNRTTTAEVR